MGAVAWQGGLTAVDVWTSSCLPGSVLMQRQAARLDALLSHAVRCSPLYRELAVGMDVSALELSDFPVVTKRELMPRFDEWVTDPALRLADVRRFVADTDRIGDDYLGRYQVWESSGSSGEPGLFVHDQAALAVYDALEALRRPVLQPLRRTNRIGHGNEHHFAPYLPPGIGRLQQRAQVVGGQHARQLLGMQTGLDIDLGATAGHAKMQAAQRGVQAQTGRAKRMVVALHGLQLSARAAQASCGAR